MLRGRIRIGLDDADIAQLAQGKEVRKAGRRDLAAVVAQQRDAATTVSATLYLARTAGIRLFATGGIGGVHRDPAHDVSADLLELTRQPVAVVCAGAKSILDLPRTLEMLETLGVPVFGFQTDEFPAFYRRSSGLPVDRRFDTLADLASAVRLHFSLGLGTGVLIANPIPIADEMAADLYDRALNAALSDAEVRGLRGRAVTPFLLDRMRAVTGGESVRANVALLRHNAGVAAALAVAGI